MDIKKFIAIAIERTESAGPGISRPAGSTVAIAIRLLATLALGLTSQSLPPFYHKQPINPIH